jgi:hypothetical protein
VASSNGRKEDMVTSLFRPFAFLPVRATSYQLCARRAIVPPPRIFRSGGWGSG